MFMVSKDTSKVKDNLLGYDPTESRSDEIHDLVIHDLGWGWLEAAFDRTVREVNSLRRIRLPKSVICLRMKSCLATIVVVEYLPSCPRI